MNIVDTHAHIYSEDVDRYPQISEPYLPPNGHGTIEHLKEETKRNSINKVVVVQTFTAYQHDNRLLIDKVERNKHWLTDVLNLDPFDIESVEIMKSARQVGVVGNRVSEGWTTNGTIRPEHDRLRSTAQELGMVICALLNPPNCQSLANSLEAYPKAPVVLDHWCFRVSHLTHTNLTVYKPSWIWLSLATYTPNFLFWLRVQSKTFLARTCFP